MELSIVSDTICPWCYVGKRRIDAATAELRAENIVVVTRWLPFELNPNMPLAGMDRRTYRSAKFGSWARSQSLDAGVAAEGAREGIVFRHDLIERTPNTRASHRLIWLAGEVGGPQCQDSVVEALFSAYFCQGRDIGDPGELTAIGASAGLPRERVEALLLGDEGVEEILLHERQASAAGVQGVPAVFAGDELLFSGAQPAPLIADALRAVLQHSGKPAPRQGKSADART